MKIFNFSKIFFTKNNKDLYIWLSSFLVVGIYSYFVDDFIYSAIFTCLAILLMSTKLFVNHYINLKKENSFFKEELTASKKTIEYQKSLLQKSINYTTIGKLSSGFAHQINTPLAAIQLRTDQMVYCSDLDNMSPESLKKAAESITESINRITFLVNGVRSFVNSPSVKSEDYVLSDCIDSALALCHENIKKMGIDIQYSPQNCKVPLYGNSYELTQILFHLLLNSVEAIDSSCEQKWININLEDHHEKLLISITDSGKGIDKNIDKKFMKAFVSSKADHLGIGLVQVEKLLAKHKGSIKLDKQSENTKFVVTLPKIICKEVQSA